MTIDEFCEALAARTEFRWTTARGNLRTVDHCHCPISAVTGNLHDFYVPTIAGMKRLGLAEEDASAIMRAADSGVTENYPLQDKLLLACRL